MTLLDNALSSAMSSGTFTTINANNSPTSGQADKENIPPSYYSGQSGEEQDDEFDYQFKKSTAKPRNDFEASLIDVGIYEETGVNPQCLTSSMEAEDNTAQFDADDADGEPEYIYQDIIKEARQLAEDEIPDFCVKSRPRKQKDFKKIVYHIETDEEEYPNPDDDQEYAVKCKGNKYYIWRGSVLGLDHEPIASTKKDSKSSKKASASSPPRRESLDAFDASDYESTPRRTLRGRTDRQQHPFQADKIEYKHASKGIKLSQEALAKELKRARSPTTKPPKKRRSISSHRSIASISSLMTSATQAASSDIDVTSATVRTHFSEVDAVQTLAFTAQKVDTLIDEVEKQWEFALSGRLVKHCTVSLPWKTDNASLLLLRNNNNASNTFDTVIEEIRRAPAWRTGEICFVDIHVFV